MCVCAHNHAHSCRYICQSKFCPCDSIWSHFCISFWSLLTCNLYKFITYRCCCCCSCCCYCCCWCSCCWWEFNSVVIDLSVEQFHCVNFVVSFCVFCFYFYSWHFAICFAAHCCCYCCYCHAALACSCVRGMRICVCVCVLWHCYCISLIALFYFSAFRYTRISSLLA